MHRALGRSMVGRVLYIGNGSCVVVTPHETSHLAFITHLVTNRRQQNCLAQYKSRQQPTPQTRAQNTRHDVCCCDCAHAHTSNSVNCFCTLCSGCVTNINIDLVMDCWMRSIPFGGSENAYTIPENTLSIYRADISAWKKIESRAFVIQCAPCWPHILRPERSATQLTLCDRARAHRDV